MSDNERVDINDLNESVVSQYFRVVVDESLAKDKEIIVVDRAKYDRQQEAIEDLKKKASVRLENIFIPIGTTCLGAFLSSLLSMPPRDDWRWWVFIFGGLFASGASFLISLCIFCSRRYVTKQRLKDVKRMSPESTMEEER